MANKSFSIVFDASMNISQMTSAVKKIQTEFNKLQLGGSFQKSFTSLLVELDSAIKNFETKSGQEITSKKDVTEIENATRKIVNLYERLKIEAKTLSGISNKELQKFFPEDLEKGLKQVKSYLDEYEKTVEKNNKEIEDKQKQQRQAQEKLNKAQQKDAAKGRQRISASEMRDLKNSQAQLNKQRKKQQETIAQLEEEREKRITSGDMRIKKDGTADKRYGDAASNQKVLDDIQKARVELETLNQQYNQVSDKISGSITEADYNRNLENIQREIKEAQKAVTDFEQEISSLKANPQSTESFENLRKEVEKLTGLDLSDITQDLDGFERLKQIFDDFQTGKIEELKTKINQLDGAVEVFGQGAADAKRKGQALGDTFTEMSREAQDLARLQDQVLDFFSLSNTIQIFKNAIRDAFETVKELDAVMTETAVVTDFSIGDMWDKLPEYSTEANKLGTSIKSLYEATTLYYQQGLNSDQAMDVGIETMKMARIANMDAAAATEAMTAALRGFNMEINETNATRINDVYSELAAITAADTEQIATAMSKTASIADAANMEFETTAAFLAQIIETTQEAPETAGTAMKTIIARFTEVKELFDEGMLSGKDTEGEEININKIDAALKKVGISLNDFLKGEKGIDDIFLELASKWDTLDLATQRYIATTAAGSRQQSRFLAMMGNYDRTMELVTAANNSAGASQKQFDKTLESLEAKLQRLNNAWQEFTMGLANNEVIKAGVDLLTWLLETINKITGVAGNEGLGGVITMFARLATVIGALKGGGAIIKGLLSEVVKTGGLTKEQMKMMGTLGMDEAGNWVKDISLMNILVNTLNITTEKSHILFGKLGIAVTKAATGFKLAGAEGAVAGAAVTIGWLPVVGIIAGIIVTVIALVAAFKAAHAASPEGKLEAASAAADSAAEAAEGAAQAYEHLAAALGSIGGKSAALENLAVGTTEWKNAVQELNGEVLDLVEQYPELAKFVDSSKGYLSFTDKKVDGKTVNDVLETYQDNKFKAQSASAAAELQKRQAQIDLNYSKLDSDIKIIPKIDIPEYNPQYYSTQISQLQGGPYSAERAQKIAAVQKEWSEAEIAYNEAKLKEADVQFLPETRELTEKVAKAIASNQIEGISIDEKAKNKTIIVDGESYTFDDSKYDKLKEYGEGLVAADAATKVFASSLLSNATMISDVSEDQKSNMMNFFNSDQVESMLETEKTSLKEMDEVKWEKQKEAYAKAMDYTYSDGNIYKGEAIAANKLDLSKDSLIEQIAGMNVTDSISSTMDKLAPKLSQMDASQAKLVSAFSSQNLDNLTVGEIDSLISTDPDKEMTISKIAEKLGYGTAQQYAEDLGYQDLGVFEQDIEKFKVKAQEQKDQITKDFNDLTGQENWVSENLADASYSTLNGLKEQASQMAPDAAREYLNSFAETVKNEDLSEQDQKALQSYLSNVDWSDMTQAINAMDYMQQMGMDSSAIKEFWDTATDGANTYMSSLSQVLALTEKFQGKIKQVDEIEEALADGKATNEQMQQLIDTGVDVSNFELTADGWKATKVQIEEATRKLREYNAEQARAANERQKEEYAKATTKERKEQFGISGEEGTYVIDSSKLGGAITAQDGKIVMGSIAGKEAEIGDLFGLKQENYASVEAFHQAVQAALMNYINLLNNGEQIQIMANKATALAEAAVYTTDENVQRGGSAESVRMSMQQEASDKELDVEEVTKYAEALVNVEGIESRVASQIAIDYAQMAQGMEEVNSKWDEWQAKLTKPNEMEKAVALNEMAEAANKMLGVAGALDAEFLKLEGSMELVQQAAKGDVDAFNQLQKAAVRSGLEKLKKDLPQNAKNFEKVNKALDQTTELAEDLADTEVNVGETFKVDPKSIDVNSIAGQLTQLYNNAYAAALEGGANVAEAQNAANAAIEAAGYEAPEMVAQTVTVTGSAPDSEIPNISITDVPGIGPVGSVEYTTAEGPETSHQVTQFVPAGSGGFTKKAETVNAGGGSGGGGGGGGGDSEPWKNSIDKLYNVQENIDRTTREREKIERRYQRLIDRRLATAQELQRASQAEIESLKEQAKYQQQMVDGRKEMLLDEMAENSELKKYATVNVETGQITIDWELINSVTDEEEGSAIEEYLSKLEELRDSMHEAQDALEDINDAVWEIEERGREEYMEFEDRIKEALVEVRQKEIDALEEINESINDTNTKLLDSIQQSVDKMRQDRENERTEEDLQEKQRQLAYLEQDTSGANAMEILELQEEIRQGQEDYTDALIDQKISELQEQNDAAAEQREKQITLLQNQLDWTIESGRIWAEVDELLKNGLDPQGGLIRGSKLEQILKSGENWVGLSSVGQMDWLLDLETLVAQSMNWQMNKGQLENLHESLSDQEISFKNAKGETVTGKVDSSGKVWTGSDTYYKDVYKWIDGTYHTTEESATKYVKPVPVSYSGGGSSDEGGRSGGGKQYPYIVPGVPGSYASPEEAAAAAAAQAKKTGEVVQGHVTNYVTKEDKGNVYANPNASGGYIYDGEVKKYKTGGLADFTGPAWLDGTKSRPELVLNQRDTQNFIQLKDILSSIMSRNFSNASTTTENNGDITYDIDINVETMGSDYDVEQVANKVKSMINEDARYRNNNAISLKR